VNWLALAGWGVQHEHEATADASSAEYQPAPDSTALMTFDELVSQFDLSALTHRRMVLDPAKLEFLNKHHLMRTWSTPTGLEAFAQRVQDTIKKAFPTSQHTSIEYIKNFIHTFQGRITNVQDIPSLAPYLFVDPDLSSQEAKAIKQTIFADDYARALRNVRKRLEQAAEPWEQLDFVSIMRAENRRIGMKPKIFMTSLRLALSGMATGPSVHEILCLLGRERSLRRLEERTHEIDSEI